MSVTSDRKARQREGLRQEILDAARTLFVREGYENVSIRKIADKVQYAAGTIYLYFKDKAEIFQCLCDETFAKLSERMSAIHHDAGDPMDQLRRAAMLYINFGLENPSHYIVTFILSSEVNKRPSGSPGSACFDNLRALVQKCIDADELASTDVDATAQSLWAIVHGVTSLLIMHPDFPFVERTRLIERAVQIMQDGLRRR